MVFKTVLEQPSILPHLTPDSTRQFSRDFKTWGVSEKVKRVEREYDAQIRVTFSSDSS